MMRVHLFDSELWLPQPREEVFGFFSDATNLDAITPPWLKFHTVSQRPIDLHLGTFIDYKLRIHGIPIRWRSEITAWEPPARFVDEQVRGPYRLWIHEHTFAERDQGTVVTDRVHYAVPFDWLVHRLLVQPDVEQIFAYRTKKLREKFS